MAFTSEVQDFHFLRSPQLEKRLLLTLLVYAVFRHTAYIAAIVQWKT